MTTMIDTPPKVTQLPGWELSRLVMATQDQPCAAPGADPEAWFPLELERPDPDRAVREAIEARARALCRGCPVELACLERAISLEGSRTGHGIAGGTTPWQRQAVKAGRGLAGAV